jgi:small subunit ribosomal protein S1
MTTQTPTDDIDFEKLLNEYESSHGTKEGEIVKGRVIEVSDDYVTVDIGYKSEGQIPVEEFVGADGHVPVKVGDEIDVYLEESENEHGQVVLSKEKADKLKIWDEINEAVEKDELVKGTILGRVKGGLTVDIGVKAFLPGSQVDLRPVRNLEKYIGEAFDFKVIKFNKKRGNIVLSRRAILEKDRAQQKAKTLETLEVGLKVTGTVKNITDYGCFVDLGGIDGLLHITDMSWGRINHPGEMFEVGDEVEVMVLKFDQESERVSLGLKQITADPWETVTVKYRIGDRVKGKVVSLTDYGAFVELEDGIEGLIHVSEMSWTKKNVHPGKILSTSQEVDVVVLEVDPAKRRISLGLKQTLENPWEAFARNHPVGSVIEGEVKNKTEFGLFVGLDGDVDGMVHLSDLDWTRPGEQAIETYNRGDVVRAQVLDVDIDKERISLGIKQLQRDTVGDAAASGELRKNAVVTCEVTGVKDGGIEVRLVESGLDSFIKRSDLSRDRDEQRPERFTIGQKVDARVLAYDKKSRKVQVSIKALEIAEEKEAVAQYGSTDSGASLGDILGAALKSRGN